MCLHAARYGRPATRHAFSGWVREAGIVRDPFFFFQNLAFIRYCNKCLAVSEQWHLELHELNTTTMLIEA
jgi:hypothetical protein